MGAPHCDLLIIWHVSDPAVFMPLWFASLECFQAWQDHAASEQLHQMHQHQLVSSMSSASASLACLALHSHVLHLSSPDPIVSG